MNMRTLVKPSRTGLQTIRKNLLRYASVSTIVIGSTLGGAALTSASAANLTITTGGSDVTATQNAGGTDGTQALDDGTNGHATAAKQGCTHMGHSAGT